MILPEQDRRAIAHAVKTTVRWYRETGAPEAEQHLRLLTYTLCDVGILWLARSINSLIRETKENHGTV